MEQLGFDNKPGVQAEAGESFSVRVSDEQLSLLDAPLTVVFPIFVEASEIAAQPLWPRHGSVQQGHAVVLDDEMLVSAFSSGSALGTLYALAKTVPLFADALSS